MQQELGGVIEGSENVESGGSDRFIASDAFAPVVQKIFEIISGCDVLDISLVELQNVREVVQREILFLQVFAQISQALDVFFHFVPLRIRDKYDGIDVS
jgi:hypothetical protein